MGGAVLIYHMSRLEKKSAAGPNIVFWVVFICAIVLVVSVVLPRLPHEIGGRPTTPSMACINNLRQIDAAAQEFALEHHLTNGDRINFPNDLTPYIKLDKNGKMPSCPQGGIYSIKKVGDVPTCSLGTTVTPAHVLP